MTVQIIHGDALDLPLEDETVDLVVTSPPYFGLRSYRDNGEHYDGQIGSEATPVEFVDALIRATREMVRVLKPSGSIWVNLGDKYSQSAGQWQGSRRGHCGDLAGTKADTASRFGQGAWNDAPAMGRPKSLMGIPWRYALRCIDDLGLILRAEVIWAKPNGLPESVTDRVRRSHEQWFHLTKSARYFSAVDAIREEQQHPNHSQLGKDARGSKWIETPGGREGEKHHVGRPSTRELHPLGKLPGSVWTIPTEPLRVPDHLGIDHFAAFPTELPRRIIQGWSPREVCTVCGEGRRPVTESDVSAKYGPGLASEMRVRAVAAGGVAKSTLGPAERRTTITGYACACPDTTAPATPGVVLDPFGGTGTTALVASVLGRHGISVDLSRDYVRLAEWRTTDPGQRAKAARVEPVEAPLPGQLSLFEEPA